MLTLDGHRNVVYAIAFNNPWGNKIVTGSFDKTCKLWNAEVRVVAPICITDVKRAVGYRVLSRVWVCRYCVAL